ncbi:MAG: peptide chain release factor N(5)-glutamine methyltransferase [candidate division WOR-3 bacterium]
MKTACALIKDAIQELPQNEIETILVNLLHKQRYELYLTDIIVPEPIEQKFHWIVQERKKGKPLQYLLNSAPFLEFELYLEEGVFIPRPETEELVIKTANRLKLPDLILELGTGSGAIAIALASFFPKAKIIATDIDPKALAIAKINIEKYKLVDRISLIEADLLDLLNSENDFGQVDCLISNPPYIDTKAIAWLDKTVKDYEPRLSLDGGPNGFALIRAIIVQGRKFLRPNGLIALEIDPNQKELILELIPWAEFESDLSGKTRFCFISYKDENYYNC